MAKVSQIQAKQELFSRSNALGNSHYGLREMCSDLLNNYGKGEGHTKALVEGTFLSASTLDRLRTLEETENGDPYRPQADTCERVLKYFGVELQASTTRIKAQYMPKAKN